MSMFAENIWHAVHDACIRGMTFLHEDASGPHEDAFGKRYRSMMPQLMHSSAELEAENESGNDAALDVLIADLIASRH